jgi:hypothetical protein
VKLGTENKKSVGALAVLTLGLGYAFYANVIDTGPSTSPATRGAPPPAAAPPSVASSVSGDDSAAPAPPRGNRSRSGEFHPIVHAKRLEDRMDTASVDPTLHLELLAKLQGVPAAGDGRNLFAIGEAAKPPGGPEPKIAPRGPKVIGPPPPPPPPGPPPPEPLPPINFKYYGFSTVRKDGRKAAFFLQNDIILIKSEGDMVAGSYKLIRIDRATAVVEDTKSKRQQTVVLAEEAQQG